MATETKQSLHAIEERGRSLSQVLEYRNLLARLRTETFRITAHLAESNSVSSAVSRDAIELVNLLRTHQASYSDNIQTLAEGIIKAFRGHAALVAASVESYALEES